MEQSAKKPAENPKGYNLSQNDRRDLRFFANSF